MARSIEQIYQEILQAKDAEPALRQQLTTRSNRRDAASRTAIWQLWSYVFAVVANSFERLWDVFRGEVEQIISERRLGTPDWYVTVSREFQFDSESDIIFEILPDGIPGFTISQGDERVPNTEPTDEQLIIQRAAFRESNTDGILILKVAAVEEVNGIERPIPLDSEQLVAFANYIDRIKFAGTAIQIVSQAGDQMVYQADVFFDSTQALTELDRAIKDAIQAYVDNLPFTGFFILNDLIRQVRLVPGVEDVVFNSITFARLALNSPANGDPIFTEPEEVARDRNYETGAGYIDLQEDRSNINLISVAERIIRQSTI